MGEYRVKIRVKPDPNEHTESRRGYFKYDKATLTVKSQDTIQWRSKEGRFAIHFSQSPFERAVIQSQDQKDGNGYYVTDFNHGRVGNHATSGVYKYAVAVAVDNDKVFVDACPEVIIECG